MGVNISQRLADMARKHFNPAILAKIVGAGELLAGVPERSSAPSERRENDS